MLKLSIEEKHLDAAIAAGVNSEGSFVENLLDQAIKDSGKDRVFWKQVWNEQLTREQKLQLADALWLYELGWSNDREANYAKLRKMLPIVFEVKQ
jgi:hypothetical protein